jgi:type IV secretion system protein VirD4
MIWKGSPCGFDKKGRPISHERGPNADGNEPTLILGPQGSNKSMGVAAIELLNDEGKRSFWVWDPKLELAAITANYRRRVCGKENVFICNPYDLLTDERPDLKSDKWNPLNEHEATIAGADGKRVPAPGLSDACVAIGDAVVPAGANEPQKHFINASRSAFAGGSKSEILETDAFNRDAKNADKPKQIASLPNVRATLTQDHAKLQKAIERMIAGGDFDVKTRLSKFLGASNTELENVRSNIESATGWMSDAMRRDMVTAGGIRLRALSERPTTIFFGLPPEEMKPEYMRLAFTSVVRPLYRPGGVPVTLLIDEGYILGRHEEVIKALSILRGFGHRMTIIYQSLSQIKALFPDTWGLFTAGAVIAFRPGDMETAEWMSKRAGEIWVPSLSASNPSNPSELGARDNIQPQKRQRFPVGNLFAMPRGKALVWLPGDDAARVSTVKGYFDIPELAARADPNPYYKPSPAAARSAGRRRGRTLAAFTAAAALVAGAVAMWPRPAPSVEQPAASNSVRAPAEPRYPQAAPRNARHAARRTATLAHGMQP